MNRFVPDENFLARWMSGELSEAELAEWKASPDFIEYMHILDTSAALEVPASRKQADIWNDLSSKLTEAPAPVRPLNAPVKKVRWPQWTMIAAAAAALLFALYLFLPKTSTHQTLAAQSKQVTLPDGSIVHMHANSRVSFTEDWEEDRNVYLEGEAFFDVKKGEKFTVSTQQGTVEVLGTSFNIKTRAQTFETTCYTGKVHVASFGGASDLMLTPGMAGKLDKKGVLNSVELNLEESNPTWMDGKYQFRASSLQDMVSEYERIFDININLEVENDRIYNHIILSKDQKTELEKLILVIGGVQLKYEAENQIRILPMP